LPHKPAQKIPITANKRNKPPMFNPTPKPTIAVSPRLA
jgi:hypothetical protein